MVSNAQKYFSIPPIECQESRVGVAFRVPMNLGDTVIFTALLRELKNQRPNTFVVVDGHRTFSKDRFDTNPFIAVLVGNPNIDLLIKCPQDFLSLADRPKIQYFYHIDLLMYQACLLGYWRTGVHEADIFCDILGLDRPGTLAPEIYLDQSERARGEQLARQCTRDGKEIVILHCDAVNPLKHWPIDHWSAVVRRLSKFYTVIQVGTDDDFAVNSTVNLVGKLSLRELAALVGHAGYFLGVDSGIHHLCRAMGCKCVVIAPSVYPKSLWAYPEDEVLIRTPEEIECAHCEQNRFGMALWELSSVPAIMDQGIHCCTQPICIQSFTEKDVYRACQKAFRA